MNDQLADLSHKDAEIKELETQKYHLELELTAMKGYLNICSETTQNLSNETERDFMSRSFLREELQHLENLRNSVKGNIGQEKIEVFLRNMQALLKYMERIGEMREKNESISIEKK